ncbi:DNA alkylation repair protein [Telluribacter sp.]|jgi:3-methyladenine DNA glycosylase AlkD|uniref:DNA alkylation repair protein n=1 Tax=Telluribacter sp. TaxID=1978767 RepID=UPI002E12E6F7|nr:DNA alkylation repair protein [Telluribacter sp.]
MEDVKEVMNELAGYGNDSNKKVFMSQGAREPLFGVRVGDVKKLAKRYAQNHALAVDLYRTGNSDAMYLAGMLADPQQMTPELLNEWVEKAHWYLLSEYAVAGVAAESPYGLEMARKWIDNDQEMIANAGWATWAQMVAFLPNESLDQPELEQLLERVRTTIHEVPNRVRYSMNNFLIAVGGLYSPLSEKALGVANEIGKVQVELGGTACRVPYAPVYIEKIWKAGKEAVKSKAFLLR